jgi:predicted transcriptional regulator
MKSPIINAPMRLGPLEVELLRFLWQRGEATVREVVDSGEISGAYTTLMTTLDRLHKKGFLNREPEGRAFRYSPRQSREEYNGEVVRGVIRELLGSSTSSSAPLSFLVEAVTEHDLALLDELERTIERKRRELEVEAKKQ